jgi:hypothetical protein
MDKFINRLKYYGVGFGIGLVFIFIFFQNRGCSWLPKNRVKNAILERVITLSESEKNVFTNKKIKNSDIIELLNTGEIDFEKSLTEGKTKIYYISNDNVKAYFTLPEENFISEVKYANKKVTKILNSSKGFGELIHFPIDDDLVFVDSSNVLNKKQEELGYISQRLILKDLKANGRIDYEKTYYFKKPKPIAYLVYKNAKGKKIGSNAIWYKNKINIKSFDSLD